MSATSSRCTRGDVIATGTPPGVGLGVKPEPIFLKPGQVMRLGVEGLGEQQQRLVRRLRPIIETLVSWRGSQ